MCVPDENGRRLPCECPTGNVSYPICHILSERGGQLRLRTSFEEGPVHVVINGEEKRVPVQNGLVVLNTAEGDEIVIYAGNDRPEITVHPLPGNENEYHYYGVKKTARF